MWSEYFFYLMGLPENERNAQIAMIVAFWIIMFLIVILAEYISKIKSKFNTKSML